MSIRNIDEAIAIHKKWAEGERSDAAKEAKKGKMLFHRFMRKWRLMMIMKLNG